ncbi:MAG: hypothetical protein WCO56_27000 [Verrucomicrobiota bacterium]
MNTNPSPDIGAQTPVANSNLTQIRTTETPLGIALAFYGLQIYALGLHV